MKSFSPQSAAGRGVARPPAFLPSRGRRPAREIATRELRSEWSISKPGQALPPPTGTAASPSCALRSLRHPPHRWARCAQRDLRRLVVRPGLAAAQHSTTLTARPPSEVSLYFESMSLPV